MKKISRRNFLVVVGAAAAAAALTACSGSSSSSTGAASGSTAASGSAAATPSGDGVLDLGFSTGLDSLTPFRPNTSQDAPFLVNLYENLGVLDENCELQPWVAKSWVTEDNGFTYDVELYENVSDAEGNAITADDIIWNINKAIDAALIPTFGKVDHVEKTGDYSLRIVFKSNMVGTFEYLMTHVYVVSQKAFEASADEFATSCVSTSAYKLTSFTASSIMAFERRDDYWQDTSLQHPVIQPLVEKVTYHCIPESSQQGIALETGTVDIALQIPITTGLQFEGNAGYNIDLADGPQGYTLFFSGADTSPCAYDQNLRQAICYAIDAEGLITGICSGYGIRMSDAHAPGFIGANPKWQDEEYYDYDEEKARELLAASDYNGQTLSILCSSSGDMPRLAQMLQSYLLAIGINLEINSVDSALFMAIRLDGTQYDLFINSIGGPYLADAWAIRYDPAAYETGDGTSRHDYDLAELLYKTWTPEGYTEENIDEVHYYLKESAIAYGLIDPQVMTIWNNNVGMEKVVRRYNGQISPSSCTYTGI